jgi:FixJ family two-component response regulator
MKPRIFIVDDDDAVRDSLRMLLESHGMDVDEFASAGDFLRHYHPDRAQCLILDQHLPTLSGLDFLASPEGRALVLPVILLTGRGNASIRDRAYALGARTYLEKPVSGDRLVAAVADAIERPESDGRPSSG